jgi:formate-dependent nitrite reductase membrane component NrfD
MPILFVIAGIAGGLAILLLVTLGDVLLVTDVAYAARIVLIGYAVAVAVYLWAATYESVAARDSVTRIVKGDIAPVFWVGLVLVGIAVPVILLFASTATASLIIAAICAILGGVALRYVILKAGVYSPLITDE